jgi:hypothetical protein
MPTPCNGYFTDAQSVREACATSYKTEYALRAAIVAALAAQVATTNNDLFTTTVSVSGYSSQDLQNNIALLRMGGFTATLSGTTLTIAW